MVHIKKKKIAVYAHIAFELDGSHRIKEIGLFLPWSII